MIGTDGLALCERLSARIQPGFCRRYRENNQVCRGCVQAADMDRLAKDAPPLRMIEPLPGGAEKGKPRKGQEMSKKPIRECAGCGEVKQIQGRNKCGSCYHKELRAEREGAVDVVEVVDEPEQIPVEIHEEIHVEKIPEAWDRLKNAPAYDPEFAARLDDTLAEVRGMLLKKNAAYGNSALQPVRCFSKADPVEQILVRIDDKISRLMRGATAGEDTEMDLLGYLIILRMARAA